MTAALQPGTDIAGRYAIERELGHGGMAHVYLARDRRHGALVAVKVMHRELASVIGGSRFTREIQITAGLQHPHILPVLDSGEEGGVPFYTMPYVEGETLSARLTRERQLPIADAVRITREVAEALAYAHERGIIHRDIKPSNVLLAGYTASASATTAWHALLADFGIARPVETSGAERLTDSGLALGTAMYMSPEQGAGDRVDQRSDVYALGCVLYEMLAGVPPFSGATPQVLLARHAIDAVPSLRVIRPTVGPALERVITTALAKVPADRYRDADAFRLALDAAAMEQATSAGTWPVPRAAAPDARRRWRPLGAALGVLAAAAAGTAMWRASHAPALDPNRVVVFPLAVTGASPALAAAGENVATLVGSALDGAGPLRAVDGWRLLDASERAAIRDLPLARLGAIARTQGGRARWFVAGTVTPTTGDSVVVALSLVDTDGDSTHVTRSARGLARDVNVLGPRVLNEVLPELLDDAPHDVATEWGNRPTAAVAQFLLGEAAFRRVRPAEALARYEDAVAADSTFGLAAVRGAQAAIWAHRGGEAERLVQLALAQRLTPREAEFARGYAAFVRGSADSAAAAFHRAIARDSDATVTWLALGEVYTHLLPAAGSPDSLAEEAFAHARRLDSAHVNPLHLSEIYLRRGDTARAGPLADRFLAAGPDTTLAATLRLMRACVSGGATAMPWGAEVARTPAAVLAAAHQLAGAGAQLPCAEGAFAAVFRGDTAGGRDAGARRWSAVVGWQSSLLASGHADAAAAVVDSAIAAGLGGSTLFLLDATLYPALARRADSVAADDARRYGARYERLTSPVRLWHLGLWASRRGDAALATDAATALAALAARSGLARDSLYARSMDAHAALARGDRVDALRRLRAVVDAPRFDDTMAWDVSTPRAAERLALARLLLADGKAREALAVASVFDSPMALIHVLFLPASLELRAAAADSLGERRGAAAFRTRLAALRDDRSIAAR